MKQTFLKLHFAIFLFGFTPVLGKLISINAISLVWWRIFFTVIFLSFFFLWKRKNIKVSWKFIRAASFVSFLTLCNWVGFYACIKLSNISIAMITFSLISLFTAIIEPIIFKTSFSKLEISLGLISFIGISLIYNIQKEFQFGIIVGALSAFFACLNSVFNRRVVKKVAEGLESNIIMFYEMLICICILSIAFPFLQSYQNLQFLFPQNLDWLWLLCLSIACTIISFRLILDVFQHLSTFTVNISFNMEPLYGIIMAFIFFNENKYFTQNFYIGFSLVLLTTLVQMLRLLFQKK